MTKKATSMRQIFNIFKPEALKKEQRDFYQETAIARGSSSYEFYDNLYSQITMSDSCCARLLVIGHVGCGKSTELQMLMAKLDDNNFKSICIIAPDDLNGFNFSYIDIFMLIVERVLKYAKENELDIDHRLLSAFYKSLSTKTITENWGVKGEIDVGIFMGFIAKITASLKIASGIKEELYSEFEPKMNAIKNTLNALIENLNEQLEQPLVIIIDELEKCNIERVRKLFVEDFGSFLGLKAHIVVTCPLSIYRSIDGATLRGYFSAPSVMPMIKTHDKEQNPHAEGIHVIREMILKRVDESYFEDSVLEKIIEKSGGSLRDTNYLISNSAFETYMRKREKISMEALDFTIKNFTNEVYMRIPVNLLPLVNSIYNGNHDPKQDELVPDLLYCGAVFEYNGERWIDLHPLVRDYIDKKSGGVQC